MEMTAEKPKPEVDESVRVAAIEALDRQHEKGTHLSKRSHLFGWVDLYSPDTDDFTAWATEPWLIELEKDMENREPISYDIQSKYAFDAYTHIGLLSSNTLWLWKEPEEN